MGLGGSAWDVLIDVPGYSAMIEIAQVWQVRVDRSCR